MAQHEGTGRHLRAVPDHPDSEDDIPLGVTWEADPAETAHYERATRQLRAEADAQQECGAPVAEPLHTPAGGWFRRAAAW